MKNTTIGIYLITEKATGKMYVGLAGGRGGIEGRWRAYKNRFPKDLFTYEILHPCPRGTTRSELSLLEKFYIRELDCMEPMGFNLTTGGTRSTEVSEATRKRHSESKKGKPPNSAGKPQSEEAKRKKSETLKGRVRGPMPEEHKKNISTGKKGKSSPGLRNPKGPMSEERKKKQSEAQKGRVKGPMSEEQKAKQSAAMKGRVLSEEHKSKLSAAAKARAALKLAAEANIDTVLEVELAFENNSHQE